jgi:cbb3-type cytochrome oxidase cytochrome c subunit
MGRFPMPGGGPPGGGFPGGPGGRRKMPPDLGDVGKDKTHTEEWFVKYVRKPKSVDPKSTMPAFEGKIKEDDLKALAKYLKDLK